jgi:alpha-N-arabinofuranosidase
LALLAALLVEKPGCAKNLESGRKVSSNNKDIKDSFEAHIKLSPGIEHHKVSPYIYGQFIEHIGGCVYDGIWVGEDSEIENIGGVRLDTVRALRKLEVPVARWPGGLFADNYHWRDGIGPRNKRPVRQNLGWNTTESNQFGTHEFMHFCELIKTEPYLCVNVGTGTVEEARAWAEYCNSDKDTTLTRERVANGHHHPFGVKFWSIGNEPEGSLDGMMMPEYYLNVARTYAGYVKHFASQSVWRGDGKLNNTKIILAELVDPAVFKKHKRKVKNIYFDMLSLHFYANTNHAPDVPPADTYYHLVSRLPRFDERLKKLCNIAEELSTAEHSINVAVDEWGIWRHGEADSLNGLVQKTPMEDALFAAAFFHILHKYEKVYMANIAQTINVLHTLILTEGKKFCVTPTYHVFAMFKPHRNGTLIDLEVYCDKKLGPSGNSGQNALSVSVTKSRDGNELFISAVNLDLHNDITARIEIVDAARWKVQEIHRLVAEDIDSMNTPDDPDRVHPEVVDIDGPVVDGKLILKARSITTLRMSID